MWTLYRPAAATRVLLKHEEVIIIRLLYTCFFNPVLQSPDLLYHVPVLLFTFLLFPVLLLLLPVLLLSVSCSLSPCYPVSSSTVLLFPVFLFPVLLLPVLLLPNLLLCPFSFCNKLLSRLYFPSFCFGSLIKVDWKVREEKSLSWSIQGRCGHHLGLMIRKSRVWILLMPILAFALSWKRIGMSIRD